MLCETMFSRNIYSMLHKKMLFKTLLQKWWHTKLWWLMVSTPISALNSKNLNSGRGHYIVFLGMTLYSHSVKKIYMLFANREVHIGKNCAWGLEYSPRPQADLKTEGTVFRNTDWPRPANNVFIFSSLEIYFIRNICVDFLLKQFHTVRMLLTFQSSKPMLFTEVFKRRDSVFADFRTEQWRIYISWRFLCDKKMLK